MPPLSAVLDWYAQRASLDALLGRMTVEAALAEAPNHPVHGREAAVTLVETL